MEFEEVVSEAIELAQTVKDICDKVKSNKEKCGLLATLSDGVGTLLQDQFGDSQKVSELIQDKVVFARIETIRFCLKNAKDLIRNYLGKQGFEKGHSIANSINVDAKFQKVIDDLKDAERELVQTVSMDTAANQDNINEVVTNQKYAEDFLQAAERDRQRDIAAIRDELKANGHNDEALQETLEAVIELLMKQSAARLNMSPSTSSSSTHVSGTAGKSDTDYAYFIQPDCIEYERSSKKSKGDNRVKLGQGGFGTVYKAKLRRSLPIAVKVLDDSATNKAALDELRKEIRIMSCLSHPNIICFLGGYYPVTQSVDDEDDEDEAYLVMELAENKSLAYHLGMLKGDNVQQLSKSTKIKILSGLADGLCYLHMQKIVHRDIKPDNVLLDREFVPKLSDFGLAKIKATSLSSRSHAGAVGTQGYQSPEAMQGEKTSFPADIWSFGIVMIDCILNERAFAGMTLAQISTSICVNKKVPLDKTKRYESQWPKGYVELMKSCLRFDQNKRPTAMDISVVMRGIMEHSASTSSYISGLDGLRLNDNSDSMNSVPLLSSVTIASSSTTSIAIPTANANAAPKPKTLSAQGIEELFQRGENFYYGNHETITDHARAVDYYRQAADHRHGAAQFSLGYCYYNGQGVAQDYKQAVHWYQLAANQGHAQAQFNLGECYHSGQGVEQDSKQAVTWYQLAADQGHADAQYSLGNGYCSGQGVAQDYKQAMEWYQLAAKQGNPGAQCNLGDCYKNGQGVQEDSKQAVAWYRLAANQGYAPAQYNLGVCYYVGRGVVQDYEQACEWYRSAANQGHAKAQSNLGVCYGNGQGVPQDFKQSFEWYRLAGNQGNAGAQCGVGVCYYKGQGAPQDYKQAVEWYQLAANQGHAQAQYNLGVCYGKGQGVAQDYKEAVKWYRLAADQGSAPAQCNLGTCYGDGQGVAQDYRQAVAWYRLAANQGYALAQYNLSVCYCNGQGVLRDYRQAVEWCRLAADQEIAIAQCGVGFYYYVGQGVAQDYEQACEWYRSAANQGHAKAQSNLGVCYGHGQGVPQDFKQSFEWYRLAGNQGNAVAQCGLGVCYYKGQGASKDYKQAVEWYQLAACQGDAEAQFNLGVCYGNGQGLAKDFKQAVEWYRLAADQGYAPAQFNLVLCYKNGLGVARDVKEALKWYKLAAAQGYAPANQSLYNRK